MLDLLRLFIPFRPEHVSGGTGFSFLPADKAIAEGVKGEVALQKLGVPMSARSAYVDEEGFWHVQDLNHPFESLASSHTGIAFKIINDGSCYPGVMLKGSPAKVLQGHNVFGSVSIRPGAFEFLGVLASTYPLLFQALDVSCTEVTTLDVTFSARFTSDRVLQSVIDFMRGVSVGQTKARKSCNYASTAYWGSEASRLKVIKAYIKELEFFTQLTEMQKQAKRGDKAAARVVAVMSDERLQTWLKGLLRLEASLKKRWLERRDIPTNLFKLIAYQDRLQSEGRCLARELWQEATAELFSAFEGQTMKILDDDHIREALRAKFATVTPKGNTSYAKADRLFAFYERLTDRGFAYIQSVTDRATLWRHMKALTSIGLCPATLQNIEPDRQASNVIPLLRLVDVRFDEQLPPWYVEPVSSFDLPGLKAA